MSATHEVTKGSLSDVQNVHFEHPTRTKWREGCHPQTQNSHLTTVLSARHARSDEKVARPDPEFAFYHSFGRSDTSKVTKGSLGHVKNFRFTTVLSVRHVQSDEMVARRASKFAFYHSFERPTRPKWRKGRSASSKITVLSVQHARSDESPEHRLLITINKLGTCGIDFADPPWKSIESIRGDFVVYWLDSCWCSLNILLIC